MSNSVEWAQIFERYRHLSRDFQQKFQSIQSKLSPEKYGVGDSTVKGIRAELDQLDEIFQDFNSWIYISLLEDLSEARKNNAVGLLEVASKVKRAKHRMESKLQAKRLRIEVDIDRSIVVTTYITFFEQMLNLIFQNSLKYTPAGSTIQVTTTNKSDHIVLEISSPGPVVEVGEIQYLTTKGFRAAAATSSVIPGEGFGLYNCKRIADLLNIELAINSRSSSKYSFNGIEYCDFTVRLKIPYEIQ
ncbi:sensor histidine kinase KdpD [Pseudomonas protegens]|uniref:sensor histidine kinase n=1 Tax=Pseudomonas protegens TaxID=380021 RepID=UPI000F461236|nr:ATP-binding protein [Pseudomonas protegens]ROL86599.1 hypothetical protein BK639_28800 [Pseudomonas protegens]ROL95067.1 hypothetical protein BK640_28630 [Pseudomonas protegens]ROL97948.1 hypothetical protein BK641_27465 [Pseudomonas protegens]ROM07734.1 hypothetical protein BK642_14365 [Pseudomonas protegens]